MFSNNSGDSSGSDDTPENTPDDGDEPTTPSSVPIFYTSLSEEASTAETGQTLTRSGEYTFADGYAVFNNNGEMQFTIGENAPQGDSAASMSIRYKGGTFDYEQILIGFGSEGSALSLQVTATGIPYVTNRDGEIIPSITPINDNVEHHLCVTASAGAVSLYIDGRLDAAGEMVQNISGTSGGIGGGWWRDTMWAKGSMRAARIYNYVLTAAEITELANEFSN